MSSDPFEVAIERGLHVDAKTLAAPGELGTRLMPEAKECGAECVRFEHGAGDLVVDGDRDDARSRDRRGPDRLELRRRELLADSLPGALAGLSAGVGAR